MKRAIAMGAFVLIAAFVVSLACGAKSANALDAVSCAAFEVIYARGSGQVPLATELSEGFEYEREALKEALHRNIPAALLNFVELDEASMNIEGMYPAIKVSEENLKVGLQASITMSKFGAYRYSVDGGVELLQIYLANQILQNPDKCFILTGYSQGAQVIGDFINKYGNEYDGKLKYIGLLGDPRLDLIGFDKLGSLPGSIIPWYRGDALPIINGGWLGPRRPNYLPRYQDSLAIPSSSWCYWDDPICSSNFLKGFDAHGKYPQRAIPQMALEIANVINNPSGLVDKNKRPPETCGQSKQDIVVLLDTSPMMRRDATVFTDTPMYYGANPPAKMPTAGEMLTRSGCGDTRIAVMGYGREADGPPQLLLDFTKDPKAYDSLLKSLYQPTTTGLYERTQLREAALASSSLTWRSDAGKVLFALTDIAGSGPVGADGWRSWDDQRVSEVYLKDSVSQELVEKLREKDIIISGIPVQHSYSGFVKSSNDIARSSEIDRYLRMISAISGGYLWVKQVPYYTSYNFKYTLVDQTINYAVQVREKTAGSVRSVRAKVGEPLQLSFQDNLSYIAAARLRGDTVTFSWYADCDNRAKASYDINQSTSFTPTSPGVCHGVVIVRVAGTGAGCYSSCPEPFPPYMYRSIPFLIDIKPTNYIPKIPTQITGLTKILADTTVTYTWDKSSYMGSDPVVYVIRDSDGSVLSATTTESLIITDTDGTDPSVLLGAAGEDGLSALVPSDSSVVSIDLRTPPVLTAPPSPPSSIPNLNQPIITDEGSSQDGEDETLGLAEGRNVTVEDTGDAVGPGSSHTLGSYAFTPSALSESRSVSFLEAPAKTFSIIHDDISQKSAGLAWWAGVPAFIIVVGLTFKFLAKPHKK